jgi:drug/metabolite transporter (DMT)-like permease
MSEPATREPVSTRRLGVGAVALASFIWAWGTVLVKWSSLPGPTFAMFRLWAGVAVSMIALLVTRKRLTWAAFRVCALGGVLFAADIGLHFSAVKLTNVADVALIGALSPVVIVIVSARRLHETIAAKDWGFVAASFVGVVVVAVASSGSPSWSLAGDLLALLGIVTWNCYWFFSRSVRDSFDPIVYFACVMLAGAIVMTPFALLVDGAPASLSSGDLAAIVAVAVLPGFVGHTLVIWAHGHVESWRSAIITQSTPVISTILAWVWLGETIPPAAILGGAIVIGSTGAVIVRAARRQRLDVEDAVEPVT